MTEPSELERVARAIFAAKRPGVDPDMILTSDIVAWQVYAIEARAALSAIPDPLAMAKAMQARAAAVARTDDLILSATRRPGSFGRTRKDHGELIATAIETIDPATLEVNRADQG